ncbi:hypothetical protein ACP4OV_031621 [Aristida adscensionis]
MTSLPVSAPRPELPQAAPLRAPASRVRYLHRPHAPLLLPRRRRVVRPRVGSLIGAGIHAGTSPLAGLEQSAGAVVFAAAGSPSTRWACSAAYRCSTDSPITQTTRRGGRRTQHRTIWRATRPDDSAALPLAQPPSLRCMGCRRPAASSPDVAGCRTQHPSRSSIVDGIQATAVFLREEASNSLSVLERWRA